LYNKLNWGGYLFLVRDEIPKINKEQNRALLTPINSKSISKINYKYLKKCLDFCTHKNKTIILLSSPLHQLCPRDSGIDLTTLVKNDFGKIPFWDYSNYPLENDEFGDLSHLNHKGAMKFSSLINQVINKRKAINKK
jgi:hypothetical protein